MGMITLKEYAERLGKNPVVARQKAQRGTFQTARKIGRDWFIDEDEPYEDARIKTGDYIGFKYGYQYRKQRKAIKEAQMAAEAAAKAAEIVNTGNEAMATALDVGTEYLNTGTPLPDYVEFAKECDERLQAKAQQDAEHLLDDTPAE